MHTSRFLSRFKLFVVALMAIGFLSGCVTFGKPKPMTAEEAMELGQYTLDSKITALTELTAVASTDMLYVVDDPSGTPISKKITALNLFDLIDTPAELETISNSGAYASDILATTSAANFVSTLGITTSIAELNYVTDVTGLLQAQLDLKAPLASPTFTGTVVLPSNQALLGTPTFASGIEPATADGGPLGASDKEISDIFLAASAVIYGENDQGNTFTSSATGWTANLNLAATTYGSDGSVSDAELLYNDATSSIQTQLDARALESVVGTSLQANHLVNTAGVLNLTAEVALHDEANTWTAVQTLADDTLTARTSAPGTPVAGTRYRADNDTWDPCDLAGTDDYFVIYDGAAYILQNDEDGVKYSSGINTPTLIAASLNDTSTPHTLIQAEMESKYISNASGAMHLDVLADAAGWSVIFIVENAADFVIHPNDSQTWYLNGTVLAADRTISNTAATIGESVACISTGTYVFCESKYSDFVSAAE